MSTIDPLRLVTDHTIYACVVGSRAYGLAGAGSDVDRRGVFLVPTALLWSLDKPPTHVDGPGAEQFSWEPERFCELALASNPTALECLWSPIVESLTPMGEGLLEIRRQFLSIRVAESYGAYARDQLGRLENRWRSTGTVRWKQAMHMLRLLLAGGHALRTGDVLVDVGGYRERLLAVKRGELTLDEIRTWAATLSVELDAARARTDLAIDPDRAAVNDLLHQARKGAL